MRHAFVRRTAFTVVAMVISAAASANVIVNAPVDVIGNLPASVFAADRFGVNTYKDWGNEPSVTVDPLNPNVIVVSSFAFNSSPTTAANIFYSTTAGRTWTPRFSIPAPPSGVGIPNDWRFLYDSAGTLHGAILGGCKSCNVYSGTTTDPTSAAAWSYAAGGSPINSASSAKQADQPWLALSPGKVLVA